MRNKILTGSRLFSFLFIVTVLSPAVLHAQDKYPKNYFRNPLDIPIKLAGTFGEIRSNHFHTGIDIRTNEQDGLVVHAAADGYVSRINVSAYGYGNALYITHPNGFVTVYGHLSRYNDVITKYLRQKQYEQHRFAIDLELGPNEIPVKQGDTVAFSGSTGDAAGPHLHFEIRTEKSEHPLNPFLFGLTTIDNLPPVIRGICIYPLTDSSNVNGGHSPLYIRAVKKGDEYVPEGDSVIHVYGKIGVGVSTYDVSEQGANHNGPYTETLADGGDTVYSSAMNELNFGTIHYVNGHVDYEEFKKDHRTIEHSFRAPNDELAIYKKVEHRGDIKCTHGAAHYMKYMVSDFNGNTSVLPFTLQADSKRGSVFHDKVHYDAVVNWRKDFDYRIHGMDLHIPARVLFDNMHFRCTRDTSSFHIISSVYNVGDEYTPLNAAFTIGIRPSAPLPDSILRRAVMVQIDGHHLWSVGGTDEKGTIVAHPRTFGSFALMFDLACPIIKPLNIYPNKNMSRSDAIEFKISDNLSGIGSFNAYVDGQWILIEFNPKKDMIYYTFDEHVGPGKHHLKLVVDDNVGNTTVYQVDFTR